MFKRLSFLSAVFSAGTLCASSGGDDTPWLISGVYERAVLSSPVIAQVHEDGLARRTAEAAALTKLHDSVVRHWEVDLEASDAPTLQAQVVTSLEQDAAFFDLFNGVMGSDPDNTVGRAFQLTSHKMGLITRYALEFARDKDQFQGLLEGRLPQGYALDVPACNVFPSDYHLFSNGRRFNALKCVLMRAWCLQNGVSSMAGVGALFGEPEWVDTSLFVHATPVPEAMVVPGFEDSPYFFSDAKTPKALLTIHSGYALGGQRGEARYKTYAGAPLGPQDCSSFTAKYLGSPRPFSTRDLLYLSEDKDGFPEMQVDLHKKPLWDARRAGQEAQDILGQMRPILTPLGKSDGIKCDILKPGVVMNERTFNPSHPNETLLINGTGGHTGLFLGLLGMGAETHAVTISAARDMELNGKEFIYGVELRPIFNTPTKHISFFVKK